MTSLEETEGRGQEKRGTALGFGLWALNFGLDDNGRAAYEARLLFGASASAYSP